MAKKRSPNTGSLPARQRSDGRWEARLTLPDGRRRSFYGATWAEAEGKLAAARVELEKGTLADPGNATVKELGVEFFRLNPSGFRPATIASRQSYWNSRVASVIGHVKLRSLSVQHALLVMAGMRDAGLTPNTINNTLSTMASVFGYGVKANLLNSNPARLVKRETPGDSRDLPIESAKQIAAPLDAIRDSRFRLALMLGIGLGLRSGEARGLRWRDVDFERRLIHIRTSAGRWHSEGGPQMFTPLKSKSSRRDLPMPDFIYDELRAERRRQAERRLRLGPAWPDFDLVCTLHGNLLQQGTLAVEMVRIREVTGIDGLVFHHLRHLCATVMMLNNVPPRIAQGVLGHATPTPTMRIYQHVNSDALRDAADAINAAFAPGLQDSASG